MVAQLSQVLMALPQEQSINVKNVLKEHWETAKVDVSQVIDQAVRSGITNSLPTKIDQARSQTAIPNDIHDHHGWPEVAHQGCLVRRKRSAMESQGRTQRLIQPHDTESQNGAVIYQDHLSPLAPRLLLCLLSISSAVLYQNPATRRALASCLPTYHRDPVSLTLLLLTILAFTNCFVSLPLQISLLTDSCIFLDTALGESIKVPRHYWESFDIFHGFLATHFATRPGKALVKARRYRILLGGATGQVLETAKWQKVISARMKLVMALLVDGQKDDCPKCLTPLNRCEESLNYW